MVENNNYSFNIYDFLMFLLIGSVIVFCVCSCVAFNEPYLERECFEYYTKNGYILDSCSKYEDKLKTIEIKK